MPIPTTEILLTLYLLNALPAKTTAKLTPLPNT